MSYEDKKRNAVSVSVPIENDNVKITDSLRSADDALLSKLGYKSEFKREFSVRSGLLIFLMILAYLEASAV